ncbi:MAG: nicotinamide mononucleotide transporter [Bacteroidales bacterium]|nr:nicotinamide mononucleotide transporter [Bacteroidales bacterium]
MEIINILDQLYRNVLDTTLLEIIAVLFGLFSVWFAKKENILVYPTGIISVLIYVYICFFAGLYADMGINFFYFVMSVYGWYSWTRIDINKKPLPISSCNTSYHILNIIAFIFFFFVLRYVLINYTDSTVPNWDSLTTAIFIVAMWLMARKKVENWIAWIIGDIISIPLYAYKGLVFTSFQFTVFLIIAIMGYIEWRKKLLASKVA